MWPVLQSSSDFPGVGPGSADSTIAGVGEGFVTKLNSDLSSILAATFLGGVVTSEMRVAYRCCKCPRP